MVHTLVNTLFRLYEWLILIRLVLSLVGSETYHPLVRWVYRVTEPVLARARGVIPLVGNLDFSPVLVFLVLGWLRVFLVVNLIRIGL